MPATLLPSRRNLHLRGIVRWREKYAPDVRAYALGSYELFLSRQDSRQPLSYFAVAEFTADQTRVSLLVSSCDGEEENAEERD